MTHSKNPERISKVVRHGTIVAHKTGTMPGVMNDTAILTSADGKHHMATEKQFLDAVKAAYSGIAP